mgnify:CR=1 FL=1
MKNIFLILVLVLTTTIVKCQTKANIITPIEFYNIKINNTTLNELNNTKGNKDLIEKLFNASINETTIDFDYCDYTYNGFEIGFSNEQISGFNITNNKWSMTIKGKTIKIGDSINNLGNVIFNTQINGNKSITYSACDGCNNWITIQFNQVTKEITKIYYIEQT